MAIYNKSIWDYLAEAGSQGVQSYMGARQQKLENDLRLAAEERAKAAEARAQELFGLQVRPLQLREQIIGAEANPITMPGIPGAAMPAQPVPRKMFGELQYQTAGLPTLEERQRKRTTEALSTQKLQQDVTLGAEQLQPQFVQARSFKALSDLMDSQAASHVDHLINEAGGWQALVRPTKDKSGKVYTPTQNMQRLGEAAYQNFVSKANLGNLDEDQKTFVRARMDSALLDRQLKSLGIDTEYAAAAYRRNMGIRDPRDILMDDIRDRQTRNTAAMQALNSEENQLSQTGKISSDPLMNLQSEEEVRKANPMAVEAWKQRRSINHRRAMLALEDAALKRASASVMQGNLNVGQYFLPGEELYRTQQQQAGPPPPWQSQDQGTTKQYDWRKLVQPSRP